MINYIKRNWLFVFRASLKVALFILFCSIGTSQIKGQTPVKISQNIEQNNGKDYHLHIVKSQQTLFGIAKAYKITVESLMIANPDARRGIRVNQVLRVPAGGNLDAASMTTPVPVSDPSASEEYEYVYHVAGKNETFAYIAEVYLVSESIVRTANPSTGEPFNEGDYILIPVARKDKRSPVTDAQFKRSGFDPYNRPVKEQTTTSSPIFERKTAPNEPVKTISPFEMPISSSSNDKIKTDISQEKPVLLTQNEITSPQYRNQHVVKPKETIFGVARLYNISPADLRAANPGLGESLKVGQVIRIPDQKATVAVSTVLNGDSTIIHHVQKGETLYRISRQYAVGIDELKRMNKGLSETLSVGQRILIPKKKITEAYFIHKVEEKQRTKNLAREFGISRSELTDYNPSIGRDVFPNQKVKIPHDIEGQIFPIKPGSIAEKKALDEAVIEEQIQDSLVVLSECMEDEAFSKRKYRVALMLPLYLEEVNKLSENGRVSQEGVKNKSLNFLPFYKGFLLAADSLVRYNGLQLELLVYDVDHLMTKTRKALEDPMLQQADLIIGPFFSQPFEMVASFAMNHKILIVNPMTQRREILEGNPYVVKVKPDTEQQYEQVAATIADNYPNAKIFIYHSNAYRNAVEVQKLKEAIELRIPAQIKISNEDILAYASKKGINGSVTIEGNYLNINQLQYDRFDSTIFGNEVHSFSYDRDTLMHFKMNTSPLRKNIVFAYTEDRVFAMEFVNKINQFVESIDMSMIGLPHWYRFENQFNENLLRLNAHYLDPGFIDYDEMRTEFFVYQYRYTYNSEPDAYAFEGFDIGWYFLNALSLFGRDAGDCLPFYNAKQLQTTYQFRRLNEESGIENTFWNIYSFSDYHLKPVRNSYFIQ